MEKLKELKYINLEILYNYPNIGSISPNTPGKNLINSLFNLKEAFDEAPILLPKTYKYSYLIMEPLRILEKLFHL